MKAKFIAIILLVLVTAACSTNRKPLFDMAGGEPEQFRRYTGRPMVDYTFRWTEKAFTKVNSDVDFVVTSEDQRSVLERHGRPDYIRLDIKATRNEIFDEWVYWDRNVIVQFVGNTLVYEGPLLDSDRQLVTWGYPSRAWLQQYETGPAREVWIYDHLWDLGNSQAVSFSDGKLVYQARL